MIKKIRQLVHAKARWGIDEHQIYSEYNPQLLSADRLGTDVLVIGKKNMTAPIRKRILREVEKFLKEGN